MSKAKVKLTLIEGTVPTRELVLDDRAGCVLGRSRDCDIIFPMDEAHADVSRHHCRLELEAASLWIRDLGSLNGTFVNGQKIGQRPDETLSSRKLQDAAAQELKSGDEVRIGNTIFRVDVKVLDTTDQIPAQVFVV